MLHRRQPEVNEAETRQREMARAIPSIMNYHQELLGLGFYELKRHFIDTINDPTIVRQQSRFGKKISHSVLGHSNSADKEFIISSYNKATEAHQKMGKQWRKFSDQPYIVHPLRVALLSIKLAQAMGVPVTPELISTALTHDVIEDSVKFNGEGRTYSQQNVESMLNDSPLTGGKGKTVAADANALSHHDVHEDGEVNEQKYYEKIIDGDAEAILRRKIVKTADKVDNLRDPSPNAQRLYRPEPSEGSLEKQMQDKGIIFANRLDTLVPPTTLPRGLYNPPEGSLAEKLLKQRVKYIRETINPHGVVGMLFSEDFFLRSVIQAAVDISEQMVSDPRFSLSRLRQQLADAAHVDSFEELIISIPEPEEPELEPEPEITFYVVSDTPRRIRDRIPTRWSRKTSVNLDFDKEAA